MRSLHDYLRLPRTKLGKTALFFVILAILFRALASLRFVPGHNTALPAWQNLFQYAAVFLLLLLALRWVKQKLMWRLRNRLVITYLFIGLAPVVLLVLLVMRATYILAVQFSAHLASSAINSATATVNEQDHLLTVQLSHALSRGEDINAFTGSSKENNKENNIVDAVFWKGRPLPGFSGNTPGSNLEPPPWLHDRFQGVVMDHGRLAIRAAEITPLNGSSLCVISNVDFTASETAELAKDLGELMIAPERRFQTEDYRPDISPKTNDAAEQLQPPELAETTSPLRSPIRGGSVPSAASLFDPPVEFASSLPVTDWSTGKKLFIALAGTTRPSILYEHLFATSVSGNIFTSLLIGLAIAFGVIECLALWIAVRLTRTMTRSVAELYRASQHVKRGDLAHRIAVSRDDQLAELEKSFNAMSSSIQDLVVEQKEKDRMLSELAIAQEVQAHFFPQAFHGSRSLEIHGVCKPARSVSGDYYDFLDLGEGKIGLAVGDISGKGISAALLMATVHSAVRAYFGQGIAAAAASGKGRDSGGVSVLEPSFHGIESPGEILRLLNRHLYRSTQPEKFATLFLAVYDGQRHRLTYSNGGHLPPIILGANGTMRRLDAGGAALGLFDEQPYTEQSLELSPLDLLLALSDGIIEPENEFGEFGLERLVEIVEANHNLDLARIAELALSALSDWIGAGEQPDDCTLVLARAR